MPFQLGELGETAGDPWHLGPCIGIPIPPIRVGGVGLIAVKLVPALVDRLRIRALGRPDLEARSSGLRRRRV